MNNIIILGSGRSGTSMIAGLFSKAGYYSGDRPINATFSNPLGYFEDAEINELNNKLIYILTKWEKYDLFRKLFKPPIHSDRRAFWLIPPQPESENILLPDTIVSEIKRYTTKIPFCYKDPRFVITLDLWKNYLPDNVRFIVVFRNPVKTIASILQDAKKMYDPPLRLKKKHVIKYWIKIYNYLITKTVSKDNWFFVNYDDVINYRVIKPLEIFTNVRLNIDHIQRKLNRSKEESIGLYSKSALDIYKELCIKAEHCYKRNKI